MVGYIVGSVGSLVPMSNVTVPRSQSSVSIAFVVVVTSYVPLERLVDPNVITSFCQYLIVLESVHKTHEKVDRSTPIGLSLASVLFTISVKEYVPSPLGPPLSTIPPDGVFVYE